MKNKLLKLSLILLICAIVILAFAYYFYHFVTDEGFTLTFHKEPGKPFIADMIGDLGVLFIFGSAVSFISSFVFFDKEDAKGKKEK